MLQNTKVDTHGTHVVVRAKAKLVMLKILNEKTLTCTETALLLASSSEVNDGHCKGKRTLSLNQFSQKLTVQR